MQKPETNSGAETTAPGQSPQMEVKAALTGFLGEFNAFQAEIKAKLQEQETRLAMLDRKSIAMNRPPLARAAETDTPHKKAFAAYLRSGDDGGLRGLPVEEKALSAAVAADVAGPDVTLGRTRVTSCPRSTRPRAAATRGGGRRRHGTHVAPPAHGIRAHDGLSGGEV